MMKLLRIVLLAALSTIAVSALLVSGQNNNNSGRQTLSAPLIIADLTDGKGPFSLPFFPSRGQTWKNAFTSAVNSYTSTLASQPGAINVPQPIVVDTEGNGVTAVTATIAALSAVSATPSFVVVADSSATVTSQVLALLQQRIPAGTGVPIFVTASGSSAFAAGAWGDNVIRFGGADEDVAANIVEVLNALSQQTVCLVTTDDLGGRTFRAAIEADIARRPKGYPVLLKSLVVASNSNAGAAFAVADIDASDDAAMLGLVTLPSCSAVLVGGEGDIAARILSSRDSNQATMPLLASAYFFFAPTTMARFPPVSASSGPLPRQTVIFANEWEDTTKLSSRGMSLTGNSGSSTATPDGLNDAFSATLGPVLDAIALVFLGAPSASSTTPASLLKAVLGRQLSSGFSTPLSVSAATLARVRSAVKIHVTPLSSNGIAADPVLGRCSMADDGAVASCGLDGNSGVYAIPAQAAQPFVVCLVGQQSCPTLSQLNHAYFTLLASAPTSLPATATIVPRALSAGTLGITTVAAVAKMAASCDFVLGPGQSMTARNLFPVFNFYSVPMVDFSSTDDSLSSRVSYGTYARVNPTDMYVAQVAGSTFRNFGWDSVAIVTTQDNYGEQIISAYSTGLAKQRVSVEASLVIPVSSLNNDTVYRTLLKIKNELITRIVVLAISSTDDVHALFFQAIAAIPGMTSTQIFWMSDSMCQYGALNPAARNSLQNSFCASPQYDEQAYRTQYASLYAADLPLAQKLFSDGGFDVSQCNLRTSDMYAPFASDAALTVLDSVGRLSSQFGGNKAAVLAAQKNLSLLMSVIGATRVKGVTGIIAFDPVTGQRTNAAYTVDIQQPNGVVLPIASWNSGAGFALADIPSPIVWFNNGTAVPKYTTRDLKFIVQATVQRNTASVVFSIVGFVVTVAIFCFCYKHYKMEKLIESGVVMQAPTIPGTGAAREEMQPRAVQYAPQQQQQQPQYSQSGIIPGVPQHQLQNNNSRYPQMTYNPNAAAGGGGFH